MADQILTSEQRTTVDLTGEIDKPRLLAFLFAEWAETTVSGKAVIAGVFDRIFYQKDSAASFYIYARLAQALEEPVTITILAPDGAQLGDIVLKRPENAVRDTNQAYLQIAARLAFPFDRPGLYWFSVVYKGERLGLAPLQVDLLPEVSDGNSGN